jgi:hypothetical protein
MLTRAISFLLLLSLAGCGNSRQQAASAATIWEAADALEKGAAVQSVVPAIKANAAALIKSTGHTYEPAGVKP